MDEQVKARLIGATVLVVIAVLLVPELLSGRKATDAGATAEGEGTRGKRTYTIDLGGTVGEASRLRPDTGTEGESSKPRSVPPLPAPARDSGTAATAPAGLPEPAPGRDDSEPRPAASSVTSVTIAPPAAAGGAAAAVSAPPRPTAPPAATPPAAKPVTTKPVAAGKGGGWAVQVGAFGSAGTARKLVADLQRDGFPAYVAPLQRGGKTLHRVRVGPVPSKAEAQQLATRVKSRKLPAAVVAAD